MIIFSQYHKTMHKVWLKAFREGELTLTAQTLADAHAIRFGLYNSVKPLRDGKADLPQVREAMENCTVRLDTEAKTVTVSNRMQQGAMLAVLEALGEEGASGVTEQVSAEPDFEQAMLESQQRMMERLSAEPVVKANPYLIPREER